MPKDEPGVGARKQGPVEVFYFPKRPRTPEHVEASRTQSLTIPEIDLADLETRTAKGSKKGKKASKRAHTPTEVSTPTFLAEKPERRVRPRRAMSPEQVAEMSLFGHQLFEMGRLEEARVVFEGLVGLEVKEAFPYTMLGTIYLALGDHERALALFEAALRVDRNDLAALVYRGEIRLSRGNLTSAEEDLRRAVKLGLVDDPFVERAQRLLRMVQEMARTASR